MAWLLALSTWGSPAMADDDDDDDDDYDDDDDDDDDDYDDDYDDDDDDDYDDDDDDDDYDDDDEDSALRAVRSEEAIPLREMIKIFRREVGGEIIDIALFKRRLRLHYRFQYIDSNGHVATAFFVAATGLRVDK